MNKECQWTIGGYGLWEIIGNIHQHPELKETLEALEKSINKWRRIAKSTKAVDKGGKNCALCELFPDDDCKGCPISTAVGNPGCRGTPYAEWVKHHIDRHRREIFSCVSRIPHCKECLKLAREEVIFLESLLPGGEQTQ